MTKDIKIGSYVCAKPNAPFAVIPISKVFYDLGDKVKIERISKKTGKVWYQIISKSFLEVV